MKIANRRFCSQSPLEVICFKALRNSHISIFHLLALAEVLCKRFSSIWDEKKYIGLIVDNGKSVGCRYQLECW